MIETLFFFAYVGVVFAVFFVNRRNSAFVRTTLKYFILITPAACLLQYGGVYSMRWDYSRWHLGDDFGLFPLRVSAFPPGSGAMSKYSFMYWFLTFLTTSLYITFPQAVLNGSKLNFRFGTALKILAGLFGIGLGFFSLLYALSSLIAPYPCQNWLVLWLSFIFIAWMMGTDFMDDVRGGVEPLPGGFALLNRLTRWWRGSSVSERIPTRMLRDPSDTMSEIVVETTKKRSLLIWGIVVAIFCFTPILRNAFANLNSLSAYGVIIMTLAAFAITSPTAKKYAFGCLTLVLFSLLLHLWMYGGSLNIFHRSPAKPPALVKPQDKATSDH